MGTRIRQTILRGILTSAWPFRAHQIQQHLGIDAEDADGRDTLVEDEAYDVDTNMTPEEVCHHASTRAHEPLIPPITFQR